MLAQKGCVKFPKKIPSLFQLQQSNPGEKMWWEATVQKHHQVLRSPAEPKITAGMARWPWNKQLLTWTGLGSMTNPFSLRKKTHENPWFSDAFMTYHEIGSPMWSKMLDPTLGTSMNGPKFNIFASLLAFYNGFLVLNMNINTGRAYPIGTCGSGKITASFPDALFDASTCRWLRPKLGTRGPPEKSHPKIDDWPSFSNRS